MLCPNSHWQVLIILPLGLKLKNYENKIFHMFIVHNFFTIYARYTIFVKSCAELNFKLILWNNIFL